MFTIIQSLTIYFTFASFMFFFGRLAAQRESYYAMMKRSPPFWCWEILISMVFFAFMSGIRWNVGVDFQSYLDEFLYAQNSASTSRDYEVGFSLLLSLIVWLGLNSIFYFAAMAFIQVFFVYLTFNRERYLLPFVGLTIVLGFHYLSWMNGIRQMIAATIFLFSIKFIVERKLTIFLALITLAYLFHKSALILLPIYLIPNINLFPNRYLTIIASTLFYYIGSDPVWIAIFDHPLSVFSDLMGYQFLSENASIFINEVKDFNYGIRTIFTLFLVILIVFFSSDMRIKFKNTCFNFYYNLFVLGFFLNGLFIQTHHILLRPISYLTITSVPVVAYFLFYLSQKRKKNQIIFILALFLATSYTPLSVLIDYQFGDKDYSNFRLVWLKND